MINGMLELLGPRVQVSFSRSGLEAVRHPGRFPSRTHEADPACPRWTRPESACGAVSSACDLAAKIKERPYVQVLPHDVNVKVSPCHQPEDVAPNHVHFTVPVQNRPQAGAQECRRPRSVCLCYPSSWAALHQLGSTREVKMLSGVPDYPTVAAPVRPRESALRRIPIARTQPSRNNGNLVPALIGELSFAVWLTVNGVNVARWQEKAGHSTASL